MKSESYKNPVWVLLILAIVLLDSCSSGKKAYEQGDYYDAVIKSVNRLRQNPKQKKASQTLRESYPLAVQQFENEIGNRIASNDPDKWARVVQSYNSINYMYDEILRAPGARKVIPNPVSYFDELANAKNNAAEEQYDNAMNLLEQNDRQAAKEAYYKFLAVSEFIPNFKDVNDRIDEAKYLATLKVVVEQIPAITRYSVSANFFQDNVESYLRTELPNEFVRFYNFDEADKENLNPPDQVLRIYFEDFVVGQTNVLKTQKTVTSEDSVKVGELELDTGDKVEVFNTVSAELTTYRKEVSSRGLLAMEIIDGYSNGVLDSEKFSGEFVWFSEWGNFNGDERALTEAEKKICKANEIPPPPPDQLFLEFTKPIYSQLTSHLNTYYRRF